MYEYKVKLDFKIDNCSTCPFKHERIIHEPIQTMDRITGVIEITRIHSHCIIKQEPILVNQYVESYDSKCPLKGNATFIPDSQPASAHAEARR